MSSRLRVLPVTRPGAGRAAAVVFVAVGLAFQGCGGGSAEEAGRRPLELEGAPLLVGSSLDQWSLLEIPRDGGTARIRSARDPRQVVWDGTTSLPESREIQFVGERQVLLRTGDGVVLHYDPEADELTRTGTVGADPTFSSWDGYGLYTAGDGASLLEIGARDAWSFEVTGRAVWSSPVEDGRVAVMVQEAEQRRSLWLLRRGDAGPESRTAVTYAPPGLVTAWGRRLVFRSADGRGLRFVAVPSLTEGPEVDLGGRVSGFAASPSSHEIYVALEDPPRLVAVSRFSQETRDLGEADAPITALRGSTLGQSILAYDGARVWWFSVGGEGSASTEASWRTDLPTVLPDGRVLLARNQEIHLWNPEGGGEPTPLADAGADHAWGVVRWNPAPDPVVSDRVSTADAGDAARTAEAGDESREPVEERAPAPGAEADVPPEAADSAHVPGGYYAVASSARDAGGVRELLGDLDAGGYPTAFQRHQDDAGRTWYRALVGPYPTRAEAEAAARQLRRERDLAAWVAEIGPGRP